MIFLTRINKKIFQALLKEKGRTPQRIYQMIHDKRRELDYTIPKETAANLLAAQMGIDVSKFLEKEELAELRDLKRVGIAIPPTKIEKVVRKTLPRSVTIKIGEKAIEDFSLPEKLATEAKRMAEVYPMIYVLENSIRHIIMYILKRRYGDDWWDKRVPATIRRNVENRVKQEGKNRWHSRRGGHRVFYTDFGDLNSIIINNWDDFKEIFPSQRWIQTRMEEIEFSRNIIAHNNPLPVREIKRLGLYFDDLRRQLARI